MSGAMDSIELSAFQPLGGLRTLALLFVLR